MKRFLELINQKWIWILASFLLTIFIHVGLRYYFWEWSADNFNNIVTPIATIFSVALFGWLTFRQYQLLRFQNELALSDSLAPEYEKQYLELKEAFETERFIQDSKTIKYAPKRCVTCFRDVISVLHSDAEFRYDAIAFRRGHKNKIEYFETRAYYDYLQDFYWHFMYFGLPEFDQVRVFIEEIKISKLSTDRINLFKARIKRELVFEYLSFMQRQSKMRDHQPIPVLYGLPDEKNVDLIDFLPLHKTAFARHFEYLKQELG